MIKPMFIIAPRGGIRYDIPSDLIEDVEMSDCRNVFFEDGLVKKWFGYTTLGDNLPLDGAIRGIDEYVNFAGTRWLMVMTANQIYNFQTGDSNWESLGFGAGSYGSGIYGEGAYGAQVHESFTMDDTDFFSYDHVRKSTSVHPWWVTTNGVDPIKKFTGSGVLSDLITDYPTGVTSLLARHVIEFKTYLLLLDVTENGDRYPQRIRWSDTATPDDFVNGNASYLDLTGVDWIKGGIRFRGDYIAILKEKSIWLGYATGTSDVFEFDRKTTGVGCVAGKTIANIEDYVIYMGQEDVYVFDGVDNEPIASSIREKMFYGINPDAIEQCFGKVVEDQKEYWLFVPTGNSSNCNAVWVLNYETGKWTRGNIADYFTIGGGYRRQSSLTIGDLVGTIGQQNWRIGDREPLAAMPTHLFGDTGGYLYQYDRMSNDQYDTATDAWFSTKDFNPTQLSKRFFINKIDVFYTGGSLSVSYSTDKGKTWKSIGTCSASNNLETPQSLYCKIDCLLCRLRFRNNTSGEHFEFSRANIYWEPSGRRL